MTNIRSFTLDDSSLRKLTRLKRHRAQNYPTLERRYAGGSWIVRDAIDLYYRHVVCGESILNEDDPRWY